MRLSTVLSITAIALSLASVAISSDIPPARWVVRSASDIPPAKWIMPRTTVTPAQVQPVQGSDIPPKRAALEIPKGPIYLMNITLNAQTGDEIGRKILSGPYELGACVEAQRQTGIQHTVVTTYPPSISIIECAVSHVDVAS